MKTEDSNRKNTNEESDDDELLEEINLLENRDFREDNFSELKNQASVSTVIQIRDSNGNVSERQKLNEHASEILKPDLERFLSHINYNYISQKSKEKLGFLKEDEPFDLNWMS